MGEDREDENYFLLMLKAKGYWIGFEMDNRLAF